MVFITQQYIAQAEEQASPRKEKTGKAGPTKETREGMRSDASGQDFGRAGSVASCYSPVSNTFPEPSHLAPLRTL